MISGDGATGSAPGRGPVEQRPYPLHGQTHGQTADRAPGGAALSHGGPDRPSTPAPEPADEAVGYRGPTACAAAGITYRQLDYWARTGLVEPSVRAGRSAGAQRLYSFRDVVLLKIVKRFLDTGVALQNIRTTLVHLRARGGDLEHMTLMSDGATVYECSSPGEVVALLQGGQGVFGIAVDVVWRDVEAALSQLHGERVDTGETLVRHHPADELARRRRDRAV